MAKGLHRLSAAACKATTKPKLGDGGGLWLMTGPTGSKRWAFLFTRGGRSREMGLGAYPAVGLARARELAQEARELLAQGIDPIENRNASEAAPVAVSFTQAAARYIRAHRRGWANRKHARQWASTLRTYAKPVIGHLDVKAIDTGHVLQILTPIWHAKTETASRVRNRIELVLDFAKAMGWRSGENPARWRGHLAMLLPRRSKVQPVRHHAALPYAELPAFMADLRTQEGTAALALQFTILTACRTGEAVGARWTEISDDVWTVPGGRMKSRREHRVPLSAQAIAVLDQLPRVGDYVFSGWRYGQPISSMAMTMVLRRMGRADVTVHGFRSTFRDWAAEQTSFPREVAEAALAHALGNKAEAAYQRGDLLAKRRQLMQAWAAFCLPGQHPE